MRPHPSPGEPRAPGLRGVLAEDAVARGPVGPWTEVVTSEVCAALGLPDDDRLHDTVGYLVDARCADVRVVVGGRPFGLAPELAAHVGADAWAPDGLSAVNVCNALLETTRATA